MMHKSFTARALCYTFGPSGNEIPFLIPPKRRDRRRGPSKISHLDGVLELQPFDGSREPEISLFLHSAIRMSHYCV
jgi:hypothetical protein